MLCDNRPIERVSLCVSADQAPERREKVRISIAVNAPMHVHMHVRCLGEGTGIAGQDISEGAEDGSGVGHETAVKID